MTDPVADMLTRIRNASSAGHRRVDIPVSKLKVEIARLLRDNHYIQEYKVLDDGRHGLLRVYLKYYDERPVIRELRRVSTPGLRRNVQARRELLAETGFVGGDSLIGRGSLVSSRWQGTGWRGGPTGVGSMARAESTAAKVGKVSWVA